MTSVITTDVQLLANLTYNQIRWAKIPGIPMHASNLGHIATDDKIITGRYIPDEGVYVPVQGLWLPAHVLVALVTALIENPRLCSPKFLTCEQRSV
ncbi:hypothetical protein ACWDTP_27195 [Mycobacterium sp. NPDC003449]